MRRYHRWIGSAFMLFLFYLFITGTATGIAQLLDPESAAPIPMSAVPGAPIAEPAAAERLPADDVSAMVETVVEAAIALIPDMEAPSIRLQLRTIDGSPRGIIGIGESESAFDAQTGESAAVPRPPPDLMPPRPPPGSDGYELPLATLLQEYHSGRMFGRPGEWAMLCTGIAIVLLWFTGVRTFFSLWNRRRRNGHARLFW